MGRVPNEPPSGEDLINIRFPPESVSEHRSPGTSLWVPGSKQTPVWYGIVMTMPVFEPGLEQVAGDDRLVIVAEVDGVVHSRLAQGRLA